MPRLGAVIRIRMSRRYELGIHALDKILDTLPILHYNGGAQIKRPRITGTGVDTCPILPGYSFYPVQRIEKCIKRIGHIAVFFRYSEDYRKQLGSRLRIIFERSRIAHFVRGRAVLEHRGIVISLAAVKRADYPLSDLLCLFGIFRELLRYCGKPLVHLAVVHKITDHVIRLGTRKPDICTVG